MSLRAVRVDTDRTSLVLAIGGEHVPRLLHWGPRLADDLDLIALAGGLTAPRLVSVPDPPPLMDEPPPLSVLPEHGFGFFGQPALLGSRGDRDWATSVTLGGLERSEHGIIMRLTDAVAGLALSLEWEIDPQSDVLRARSVLTNQGDSSYDVDWLAAVALRLPERFNEAMTLEGRWAGEFQTARHRLDHQIQLERVSRYGRTGHASSPTIIAGEAGFDECKGRVIGLHLGWSGNHRVLVEVRRDGGRQAQLGEWLTPGEVSLAPGETMVTPWVYGAWSDDGLSGLGHHFHDHLRQTLLPRRTYAKPRPVHLNTWEAVYFDHRPADLRSLADAAADLGIERFVLDDGWFGRRDDDTTSLGDWWIDQRKHPEGLAPLIAYVRGLGMEFGLWVEPEMISPTSQLYVEHPDWCLHLDGRAQPTQRSQLVLDLTRPEASAYVFDKLDALLQAHEIAYLKWDHNRDLAPAASGGRPAARAQTLAFYALLERLREVHPDVEIESCAGGGARADFGVIAHADRFWASDNNDPFERLKIQRGASMLFPLEVIGAHVGPSPSHQTGRVTSLGFRARAALFGHMGVEVDPRPLSGADRAELAEHIACYKRYRGLLHQGRLWRFGFGDPGGFGQIVVAGDGSEALAQLVRTGQAPFAHAAPVRLPGLRSEAQYRVELVEPWPEIAAAHLKNPDFWRSRPVIGGGALGEVGLRLPLAWPETIWLVHLERI